MRIVLVATLALMLAACGSKTGDEAAAQKRAASAAAQAPGSDEVAAVLESAGAPLARVRFVIDSRPVAGKAFNVKVIVSSATQVPQMLLAIKSGDLVVEPASVMLVLGATEGGRENVNSQTFSVTAQKDGLTELSVHLTTEANASETRYVIPVLVAKAG
jgi:PBP1b-binding outer membrane lipoprotein LpoB